MYAFFGRGHMAPPVDIRLHQSTRFTCISPCLGWWESTSSTQQRRWGAHFCVYHGKNGRCFPLRYFLENGKMHHKRSRKNKVFNLFTRRITSCHAYFPQWFPLCYWVAGVREHIGPVSRSHVGGSNRLLCMLASKISRETYQHLSSRFSHLEFFYSIWFQSFELFQLFQSVLLLLFKRVLEHKGRRVFLKGLPKRSQKRTS